MKCKQFSKRTSLQLWGSGKSMGMFLGWGPDEHHKENPAWAQALKHCYAYLAKPMEMGGGHSQPREQLLEAKTTWLAEKELDYQRFCVWVRSLYLVLQGLRAENEIIWIPLINNTFILLMENNWNLSNVDMKRLIETQVQLRAISQYWTL